MSSSCTWWLILAPQLHRLCSISCRISYVQLSRYRWWWWCVCVCVCVCVCSESCHTTFHNVSYLWGGFHHAVEVSDSYEGGAHGTRYAVLVQALSVPFICLQRRHCSLQKGRLSFISLMACFLKASCSKVNLVDTAFLKEFTFLFLNNSVRNWTVLMCEMSRKFNFYSLYRFAHFTWRVKQLYLGKCMLFFINIIRSTFFDTT